MGPARHGGPLELDVELVAGAVLGLFAEEAVLGEGAAVGERDLEGEWLRDCGQCGEPGDRGRKRPVSVARDRRRSEERRERRRRRASNIISPRDEMPRAWTPRDGDLRPYRNGGLPH